MVFAIPKSNDPNVVLQKIRETYPQAGTEKLLRIWEAVVVDHHELHRVIVARAFTSALAELTNGQKTPVASPPQM